MNSSLIDKIVWPTIIKNKMIPSKPSNYYNFDKFDSQASTRCRMISSNAVPTRLQQPCSIQISAKHFDRIPTERRSGNYKPSLWDFNYIQSLKSEYEEDRYLTRASELVVQVKMLLEKEMEPVRQLELIDDLQRLGISYHFEDKINQTLHCMYRDHKCCKYYEAEERDLYSTALGFRLLRQHGFKVSLGA